MNLLNKVGRYPFLSEPFHCDFSQRLFIGRLGNILLNAADFHSNERGYGMTILHPLHKTWVLSRLTIELEASGRHVHLSRADVETLFGAGYRLNRTKDLSQPGQFACAERVTLEGPRGSLKNVVILGPERPESQVEISLTDAVALGLTPPVRLSGDTEGTPGLTLRHGDRVLRLSRGLIVAKRHIHMTPEDAARFGVADRQRVRLQCFTSRPLVFQDVEVRVSPQFSTVVHIDYDEANACGFQKGDRGVILK